MEERNSMLPPHTAEGQARNITDNNKKLTYVPPVLGAVVVELECHITAGSITVKQTDDKVEEGWMEDDLERDIVIDLY